MFRFHKNQSSYKKLMNQHTRKFSLKKNQKEEAEEKVKVDHLADWTQAQEETKETLKNGLLSFLKYVEKVEDEKLHRKR